MTLGLSVDTPAGRFRLVGRLHLDRRRPALLAIAGAFPPPDAFQDLIDTYGGANVVVAYLPGMLGLPFSDAGIAELAQALQPAVDRLVADLPLVVLGASAGALVGLALRGPTITRKVLVEPFLSTADLWPFVADARARLAEYPDDRPLAAWLDRIFGVTPDAVRNRDYGDLLRGHSVPTDVVLGREPLLPPRTLPQWPSFASEPDRARFAAQPGVRLHDAGPGSGHALYHEAPGAALVHGLLRAALIEASTAC